jgi:hypothetical protein
MPAQEAESPLTLPPKAAGPSLSHFVGEDFFD